MCLFIVGEALVFFICSVYNTVTWGLYFAECAAKWPDLLQQNITSSTVNPTVDIFRAKIKANNEQTYQC